MLLYYIASIICLQQTLFLIECLCDCFCSLASIDCFCYVASSHIYTFSVCWCGCVMTRSTFFLVLRCDPLKLLIQYLSDKGIRPVDLFRTFDKDNQHRVSREQFIQGLKVKFSGTNITKHIIRDTYKHTGSYSANIQFVACLHTFKWQRYL